MKKSSKWKGKMDTNVWIVSRHEIYRKGIFITIRWNQTKFLPVSTSIGCRFLVPTADVGHLSAPQRIPFFHPATEP
jgi:hypothetical protein